MDKGEFGQLAEFHVEPLKRILRVFQKAENVAIFSASFFKDIQQNNIHIDGIVSTTILISGRLTS